MRKQICIPSDTGYSLKVYRFASVPFIQIGKLYSCRLFQVQNGISKYFIHYHGWNKNWDEWVPEARMMKFCDKNVEIQKDLCLAIETKEKAKKMRQKQGNYFCDCFDFDVAICASFEEFIHTKVK